jgi:arylformamidase
VPAEKVYLDYTQAELDRAYDQRAWAPNADEVIARYASESAKTRKRFSGALDVRYGSTKEETLDLFPAAARGAPLHVHVHGGGWRNLTKDEESFLAASLVPAGAALAVLNFATIPRVRLPDMIEQVRRAIGWLYAHAPVLGADPDRIHLSGHSSGAHMAAVLAATDWTELGVPGDVLKSALLMSGMYDLRPVMMSARSNYVKLSGSEVEQLSPIMRPGNVVPPVVIAFGALETPEFRRQARSFHEALIHAGKASRLLDCGHVNHFELLELLAQPDSELCRAALELMGLPVSATRR